MDNYWPTLYNEAAETNKLAHYYAVYTVIDVTLYEKLCTKHEVITQDWSTNHNQKHIVAVKAENHIRNEERSLMNK